MIGDCEPILVVPSIKAPPRVSKLLTALVYRLKIVDFDWIKIEKANPRQIEPYCMKYQDCTHLLNSFAFCLPKAFQIDQVANTPPVQLSFVKALILRTGGRLQNSRIIT